MTDTRLVAIDGEQVERLEQIATGNYSRGNIESLARSIVTAYEEGITEEEARAIHRRGRYPKHLADRLDRAFNTTPEEPS